MKNRTILIGDVLEKIQEIPDESIDCVITSPPYWGLRDYGTEGQWGLEPDFNQYLLKLQTLMKQLRRVLKSTGSVWINIGDTYGTVSGNYEQSTKCDSPIYEGMRENLFGQYPSQKDMKKNLQSKSRVGIPERFYVNSINDGWIARNHIPWIKPNAMPSSVKDRFTNKWESVFFFVKNQKYYFNLDAVREKPITEISKPKPKQINKPLFDELVIDDDDEKGKNFQPEGRSNFGTGEKITQHLQERKAKQDSVIDPKTNKPKQTYLGFNERWKENPKGHAQYMERIQDARDSGLPHDNPLGNPLGKNPGDVIYDKSKPYAVVERYGTVIHRKLPEQEKVRQYLSEWRKKSNFTIDQIEEHFGNQAGHHWFEKDGSYPSAADWLELKTLLHFDDKFDSQLMTEYEKPSEKINDPKGKNPGDIFIINTKPFVEAHFATFPLELPTTILKAACPPDGFVLDPFFGSGTVGVAAEKLGMNWIGIELKKEYVSDIITKRLDKHKNERLESFVQ